MIYLVRHCSTTGQAPEAPLTDEGYRQAETLATLLASLRVERLVSSPFRRARESVAPAAGRLGLVVELDDRLREHVITTQTVPDYRGLLRRSYEEPDLSFEGAETSGSAASRVRDAVVPLLEQGKSTVVVSHGVLLSRLLCSLTGRPGYEAWEQMTNPDVFELVATPTGIEDRRIWPWSATPG